MRKEGRRVADTSGSGRKEKEVYKGFDLRFAAEVLGVLLRDDANMVSTRKLRRELGYPTKTFYRKLHELEEAGMIEVLISYRISVVTFPHPYFVSAREYQNMVAEFCNQLSRALELERRIRAMHEYESLMRSVKRRKGVRIYDHGHQPCSCEIALREV